MHDRPEGVLQNVRENLGWPGVACLRHVRNFVFLRIAFMVMCHRIVWNSVMPEKVVRSGEGDL